MSITTTKHGNRTRLTVPGFNGTIAIDPLPGRVRIAIEHPFGGGISLTTEVTAVDADRIAMEIGLAADKAMRIDAALMEDESSNE